MHIESIDVNGIGVCCTNTEIFDHFKIEGFAVDRNLLPKSLRRRTSLATQIAVTAAHHATLNAGLSAADLPSIFASVGGEIQVTDLLCRTLTDADAPLSPTQFHNSVHNTTAGYWSIMTGCTQAMTAIAGSAENNFAMALLETWSQITIAGGPLLLVCYDETWPDYLAHPIGQTALACALVLSHQGACSRCYGRISAPKKGHVGNDLPDASLLAFIRKAPSAMAIPLIRCLQKNPCRETVPLSIGEHGWITEVTAPLD